MTAFGPFGDRQEVDFDDLGASGLLLLHGPTGAGKTSVLDAVGFALYGDVPGIRGVKGLRSEHADPQVETEVELEFSAGGRRWRIRRTPRQQVAKVRGDGMTTRQPSALLQRLDTDGGWVAVATRLDEVGQSVTDAVGLTAAQFFQVVLLPQGRFAAFLHAGADERQALLRQLFGTERFTEIERFLRERRAALGERVGDLRRALDARLEVAREIAAGAGLSLTDAAVRGLLVALTARLDQAEAAVQDAVTAERQAADDVIAAEALAARHRRRAAAIARRDSLAAAADEIDDVRSDLAAARAAAEVAPLLDRLASLRTDLASAEAAVVAAGGDAQGLDEVITAERSLRDEAAAATSALALEARYDAQRHHAERLDVAQRAAEAAVVQSVARRDRAREAVDQTTELRAAATSTAEPLAGLIAAAATARERADAAARTPAVAAAVARAEETALRARETAVAAREAWVAIARRRLDGMAAELAAQLADGAPCAVCGALEHPSPAMPTSERATEADERAAAAAADEAAGVAEDAVQQAARARDELTRLQAVTGGVPAEVLVAAAVAAGAAASAAESARASLPALERELAAATAELVGAEAAVDEAERAQRRARDDYVAAVAALRASEAGLADARGDDVSVAARVERLTAAAERAAALVEALRRREQAAGALGEASSSSAEAARAAGFADAAAAAAARRTAEQCRALDQRLRAYDGEVAAVASELADPELDLPDEAPADPALARTAHADARAVVRVAVERHTAVVEQVRRATAAADQAEALLRELAPVEDEHATVAGLAELATGGAGNRLKMSLTAFVLAARLEAVAARASVRLGHMTSGRYSLVHTDEVVDGRSRSGLGLAVCDVWTGTQRPTSSLSGGETFMTALALALGLADVVAEEAGGRRIDTLFIDEGFGSLDEAALDRVMDVLDGLRDGGRLVGLVSHVGELQRRVPARLEVVRTESGSWLRPTVAVAD